MRPLTPACRQPVKRAAMAEGSAATSRAMRIASSKKPLSARTRVTRTRPECERLGQEGRGPAGRGGVATAEPDVGDAAGFGPHGKQRMVRGAAPLLGGFYPFSAPSCVPYRSKTLKLRSRVYPAGCAGSRSRHQGQSGSKVAVMAFGVKRRKKRVLVAVLGNRLRPKSWRTEIRS